jgi:flagellar FliL protein
MADEGEENQEPQAEAAKPKASSQKNPLVAVLLVMNMVALGTVAFFQYKFMDMESKKPDLTQLLKESGMKVDAEVADENQPTEDVSKETLIDMASFTVNLAQGDGPRRYVRLNAVLKLSENSEVSEIEARKPQIRDTIISILNSKRPEDVLKRDGKLYLKQEIKSAINSFLIDGKIVDIFYVGFQVN